MLTHSEIKYFEDILCKANFEQLLALQDRTLEETRKRFYRKVTE